MLSVSPCYWSVFQFAEPQRNQGQTKGEKKTRGSIWHFSTHLNPFAESKLTIEAINIDIICEAVWMIPVVLKYYIFNDLIQALTVWL